MNYRGIGRIKFKVNSLTVTVSSNWSKWITGLQRNSSSNLGAYYKIAYCDLNGEIVKPMSKFKQCVKEFSSENDFSVYLDYRTTCRANCEPNLFDRIKSY